MPERIRDSLVAEEIAAQAGTDETPPLFLSEVLQPVIFGPQRPPLASSGYFPGVMALRVAAVASNFSQLGLFLEGTNSSFICRVNSIKITNTSGGQLSYTIRRHNNANGFANQTSLVPGYINATSDLSGSAFSITKSNATALIGDSMCLCTLEGGTSETYDGPWIINNGVVSVAPTIVNTLMQAYFNYEVWPAIRSQG